MLTHRRLSTLACLTALGAAGAVAAPAATATAPGENGRIAFTAFQGDKRNGPCRADYDCIYTMRADGKQVRAIAIGSSPAFSPSGELLAFNRESERVEAGESIFTITAGGTDRRRVAGSSKNVGFPLAWSPDGQRLAFMFNEEPFGIYTLDVRGRSPRRRLTRDAHGSDSVGDWSRGGTVVFSSYQETYVSECETAIHSDLYTTSSGGGSGRRLFPQLSATDDGNWSPDGRSVSFAADARWSPSSSSSARAADSEDGCDDTIEPAYDVYVARADGTRPRRLTRRGGHSPVWSPDGKKIAFVRDGYIWLMDASGKNERELVEGHSPDWQPR